MQKLAVVEGPNRGAVLLLEEGNNRVGREVTLEIHLPDRSISRRHALVQIKPGEAPTLSDLGSTNATYLNGIRVTSPRPLAHGDEIRLGDTVLLYLDEVEIPGAKPGTPLEDTSKLESDGARHFGEALRQSAAAAAAAVVSARLGATPPPRYLVGESEALRRISELIARCAPLDTTVLITGETGTGKELIAEALHRLSPRRSAPFVVVNCATLEPALFESELFGHERGSFTGAVARKVGKLEIVRGGTLVLDEVGEIRLEAQAKLLRAIDRREFGRLGGNDVLTTGARFVAATNRDLLALVKEGLFREDLYFRLRVVEIEVPPLRERPDDIVPIIAYTITELREKIPSRARDFTPAAIQRLLAYPFPGNVRELRNMIEHCLIFCEREYIDVPDLPYEVRATAAPPAEARALGPPEAPPIETLDEVERTCVHRALLATGWNKSKAAKLLAIDRNTLHAKIKRHGIQP